MPGVAQKVLEVGPFEMQVWVLLLIPPPGQVCGLWLVSQGVGSLLRRMGAPPSPSTSDPRGESWTYLPAEDQALCFSSIDQDFCS